MTAVELQTLISEILGDGSAVLTALEPLLPGAAVGEEVIALVAGLASKALSAWSAASTTPITAASVQALLPANTVLVAPKE